VKPKVFLTRHLPSAGMAKLEAVAEIAPKDQSLNRHVTRGELMRGVKDADALVCYPRDKIDLELLSNARRLKVISTYSVGYDHIDIIEATKRGIYITYTPDVLSGAVADLTWALMLAISRHIIDGDQFVRRGSWSFDSDLRFLMGHDFRGKTLGILGLGRIGAEVARRGRGFGMKMIYFSRRRKRNLENELGIGRVSFDKLLAESDYLSINLSLNEATHHIIGREQLAKMKKTAIIVNTSRGAVIDENALVEALRRGSLAGAGLDVFEVEPLPKDSPLLLMSNVVLLPHIASATVETRDKMAELVADNVIDVLSGRMPKALLNRDVLLMKPLNQTRMM
jgi:glyoxylate reductase